MKKICIVADIKGWAFDSIAKKLKKDLYKKYDIDIKYFNRRTESDTFYEFIESLNDYDLIHFLNRRMLLLINSDIFRSKVKKSGRDIDKYIQEHKNKFTTSVYDYMDIDENGINEQKSIFNDYVKNYYVATKKLLEIYNNIKEYKKPYSLVHDICDGDIYKPYNLERFELENIKNRAIIIGWCGNSTHSGEKDVDLKGFRTIIKPTIDELISEGYNIKGDFADRNNDYRLPEEMPKYYNEIDIYVCASVHEGTPRPVLESMYSGIPIISTNVGIVPESFGTLQKEFIIGDRNNGLNDIKIKQNLKERIVYLYNNREMFKKLSDENLESIKIFDGGKTIKEFENFFNVCLKNND